MASNIVRAKWRDARLFSVLLTGTGTASISGPDAHLFTLTDNDTGDYTLTASTAFAEPPFVVALSNTTSVTCYQVAPTSTVINVKARTIAASPAAADAVFQLLIYGCQLPSEVKDVSSNSLRSKWGNPRIHHLILTGTGTAALSGLDADLYTLVDNGTGDYSLTAVTPFAEPPFVSAISLTTDIVAFQVTPTSTVVRVKGMSVADSPAAADAVFHITIYGAQLLSTSAIV